jgi:hypothetical protein
MSEDRFAKEEPKDEDVEAHKRSPMADESSSDETDDVEAHKKSFLANDEPGSDDSDDVEAHHKKTI